MANNLLDALEAFGAAKEKEQRKLRVTEGKNKLISLALAGDSSMLPDREIFEKDVKTFIETFSDEIIEDGVNIYFGPASGTPVHANYNGLGFDLTLESSVETSKRKYTLKIHKRDIRWGMRNFFLKAVRMENPLTNEAVEKLVSNLDDEGNLKIWICEHEDFTKRYENAEGELFALDSLEQGAEHIALGLISKGKCYILVSGLRTRTYPFDFKCKRE